MLKFLSECLLNLKPATGLFVRPVGGLCVRPVGEGGYSRGLRSGSPPLQPSGQSAGWHRRAAAASRGQPRAASPAVRTVCRMALPSRGWSKCLFISLVDISGKLIIS